MKKQITFFADWEKSMVTPHRPLNILFLTSLRDVLACDRNGQMVLTSEGVQYMEGIIERTVRETHHGGALHGLVRVVGIVVDDLSKDTHAEHFPLVPTPGREWIHPLDLRDEGGTLITDITFHIPSAFRMLSRDDTEGRHRLKLEFESAVLAKMTELGAEIIISDHYMAKLEHFANGFGKFGRVLNIHPAVTVTGHPYCFRGKTPTADAIARAQSELNIVTGATLHLINPVIDDGPAIAFTASTPVYASDEPQHLRFRNYQMAKLPLFIAGVRHYVTRIFPHLGEIDLNCLEPRTVEKA